MTSYEMAKEKYAAWGVDTEKAMEQLKKGSGFPPLLAAR